MAINILRKYGYIFLLVMFIVLPFHAFLVTFFSSFIDSHSIDSISRFSFLIAAWKEILIFLMILLIITLSIIERKIPFKVLLIDYLIFLLLIWGGVSAFFFSETLSQGLVGLRFDFEFFIMYWIVRSIPLSLIRFKNLINILMMVSTIVILLGFIQIMASCDFMTKLGYTPYVSSWVSSKPLPCAHGLGENLNRFRMMSTFSGPNQLASFLIITILMAWYMLSSLINKYKSDVINKSNILMAKKFFYVFYIALAFAGLFLTYSRGALLAILVGFFCLLVLEASDSKKAFGYLVIGLTSSILVFVASVVMYPDRSISTQEHLEKPLKGIEIVISNPWGLGIGMAGPASMRFPSDGSKAIISENWYLQIAQEFGLIGAFVFFLLFSSILRFLFQKWSKMKSIEYKELLISIIAIYIALLFNNLFMHTWSSDMVTSMIFWSIFAIGVNFANNPDSNLPDEV